MRAWGKNLIVPERCIAKCRRVEVLNRWAEAWHYANANKKMPQNIFTTKMGVWLHGRVLVQWNLDNNSTKNTSIITAYPTLLFY